MDSDVAVGAQSEASDCISHLFDNGKTRGLLLCNLGCLALQALVRRDTFDNSLTPFPAPSYLQTLAPLG